MDTKIIKALWKGGIYMDKKVATVVGLVVVQGVLAILQEILIKTGIA